MEIALSFMMTQIKNTKICSFCKKELPISEFGKCKSTKDGLQYYCKSCQKLYRQGTKKLKVCTSCGEAKPIYEYYECRTLRWLF